MNIDQRARAIVLAVNCALAGQSVAAADSGEQSNAARDVMRRVAASYEQTAHGVVGVHAQSVLTIKAPVFRRRIARDAWYVFVDGALVKSSEQRDPRQPPLRDPFRADYAADYEFTYAPCRECRPGTVAIDFSSRYHDVAHASGRLVVDATTARIVSQTEKPYKLPWPTNDGQLEATWGAAGAGWFPLTVSGSFVGRIGPFVGHATYAETLSAYGRYATVDTAADALARPAGDANGVTHGPPAGPRPAAATSRMLAGR